MVAQNGINGSHSPKRVIRVANCSGSKVDPGVHMLNQAKYGNVDVVTGDYLAGMNLWRQVLHFNPRRLVNLKSSCLKLILEMNLAENAEKFAAGTHPGWEATALEGLTLSLEVLNEKRVKVVINGGSLNPKGLAEKVQSMVCEQFRAADKWIQTHVFRLRRKG
jgi:hypothetical protein